MYFQQIMYLPGWSYSYVYTVPDSYRTIKYFVSIGISTALVNYPVWIMYQREVTTERFYWWFLRFRKQ